MKRVLLDEKPTEAARSRVGTGVVVVVAPSIRLGDLEPLLPDILAAIERVEVGELLEVGR